jgi:hypothetical protein
MKIKFLMFGEAVNIPHTSIGLGVGLVSVWMDGMGFTSATNQLGALGYVLLETREIDIGTLSDESQRLFANLHGRTVKFDVAPTIFVKDGGIAQISMTAFVQQAGTSVAKTISFTADDCTGVAISSNPLSFTCEMLQMERTLAALDSEQLVDEDAVVAIVEAAPSEEVVV